MLGFCFFPPRCVWYLRRGLWVRDLVAGRRDKVLKSIQLPLSSLWSLLWDSWTSLLPGLVSSNMPLFLSGYARVTATGWESPPLNYRAPATCLEIPLLHNNGRLLLSPNLPSTCVSSSLRCKSIIAASEYVSSSLSDSPVPCVLHNNTSH